MGHGNRPARNPSRFPHWRGKHRRSRPWGLRRRLTFGFAFVALVAVGLTTWFTLGAVFSVFEGQEELFRSDAATDEAAPNAEATPTRGPFWWHSEKWEGAAFAPQREAFGRISRTAFFAAWLSFGIAVVAAAVFTRFLTRPLLALTDGARRLEAGERDLRLKVPRGRDELRSLTEAFNHLVAGLERQERWRRDMVADIAHDLRTPLAVLRSELEAMQDGVRPLDSAGLGRLHSEVMMLSHLIDDLRTLSLAEGGGLMLEPEEVAVEPFLRRLLATFAPQAEAAQVKLVLEPVPEHQHARFDPERILRVLGNLLENALRHAAPSTISLGAEQRESELRLWVRDDGPGLPEAALERLFERFYRADASRSRAGVGGSGLGLSIARALSEAHGGRLKAENHPEGGAVFTVILPQQAS